MKLEAGTPAWDSAIEELKTKKFISSIVMDDDGEAAFGHSTFLSFLGIDQGGENELDNHSIEYLDSSDFKEMWGFTFKEHGGSSLLLFEE